MQIAYLDGDRIRRALIVGAERLAERAAQLNAINVFPVPDGDTGTNMASTARSIAFDLRGRRRLPLGQALRTAADSALSGARGNSGAILAQFIQGLAEELGEDIRVNAKRFAEAIRRASRRTRSALSQPREGTILTLLDDWSEAASSAAEGSDDFMVVLSRAQEAARDSLARTREILPELRKAGVVDAGAQGFLHVLEGIMAFIGSGRLRDLGVDGAASRDGGGDPFGDLADLPHAESFVDFSFEGAEGSAGHRYCTECFVAGADLDLPALRAALEPLGDSLVLAGSSSRAKVHIYTDRPPLVFRAAEARGELSGQKVDDMDLQRRLVGRGELPCALLVDSAVDLADADRLRLLVERVPVQVELGGRRHLDRDGLGSEEFCSILRSSPELSLSTSQPAHADFARKFDLLLASAREVVYLGIAGVLSGTLEAGRRAGAERSKAAGRPGAVQVVDSRSVSIGAALVARKVAEAAASGLPATEVVRVAEEAAARTRLLVAVPDLSSLIRSGRLGGVKGQVLRAFGLHPLITLDPEGRAVAGGIYLGKRRGVAAILSSLARLAPRGSRIDAIVGHVDSPREAEVLARAIEAGWRLERPLEISDICPALALHAGLGAVAVAFFGAPRELPTGAGTKEKGSKP